MFMFIKILLVISFIISNSYTLHAQNIEIQSISTAKKELEKIYTSFDEPKTVYCQANFDNQKNVELPAGFVSEKFKTRLHKIEWEHIVPAENFGRTFIEWREGDPLCVDSKGKNYKGRPCAEKTNNEYRYMQADMYNLFPAIGAVNASRSHYNFAMLPDEKADFGICQMKIENRKVEPPEHARGIIARTYIYMEESYPRYKMSKAQRQLMQAWNKLYPVSNEECIRADKIKEIQGNTNFVLEKLCKEKDDATIVYGKNQ